VAPHEAQAQFNHGGQTLERLNERGGLSPYELYAVVHGLRYDKVRGLSSELVLQWLRGVA
jgi:hypothetical protein